MSHLSRCSTGGIGIASGANCAISGKRASIATPSMNELQDGEAMTIQRGDIILFKSPRTWHDKLICRVTHGPYYHVAVALNAGFLIEAIGKGIAVSATPINPKVFDVIDMTEYESDRAIELALAWCMVQRGKKYGWLDIAYQVLKFIFPNNPWQITQEGHWDCSDFVTRYIQKTGYPVPDSFSDPYKNTPNDIARIFQRLPARKMVEV